MIRDDPQKGYHEHGPNRFVLSIKIYSYTHTSLVNLLLLIKNLEFTLNFNLKVVQFYQPILRVDLKLKFFAIF